MGTLKKTRMAVGLAVILVLALAGTLAAQAAGVGIFRVERNIPGQAIVVDIVDLPPETVGAYTDSECTTPLTLMDWGEIAETSQVAKFFLKNEGTDPFAIKNVELSGWDGGTWWRAYVSRIETESIIGSGAAINPGEVIRMEITLYRWESTPAGEYKFVVTIHAGTPTAVPPPIGGMG